MLNDIVTRKLMSKYKIMNTRTLTKWEKMMADYGYFHQDKTNLITHFIGVPIIVASFFVPFTWIKFFDITIGGFETSFNLAYILGMASLVFYFSLDRKLASVAVPFTFFLLLVATYVGTLGYKTAGIMAAIGFFGGFALQFIGHAIEGKKPALIAYNPIIAMITSPLFVVAELCEKVGIRKELFNTVQEEVEKRNLVGA